MHFTHCILPRNIDYHSRVLCLKMGRLSKDSFAQHAYCIVFDLMCRSEIVVAVNEIKDTLPFLP